MQYALVKGIRTEPTKGEKGICEGCSSEVIAKCGSVKIHHWAHKNIEDCDSWYEPETQWHRNWKNRFPMEYREVSFTNPITNEKHRADIHTSKGVTIEFQNSPISLDEVRSRDTFYRNLIWVVNGVKFKGGFKLTCSIPNPRTFLLDNLELLTNTNANEILFQQPGSDEILNIFSPQLENVLLSLEGVETPYRMFNWKNKHSVWFATTSEVFIDIGEEVLYWLKKRVQFTSPFWYIQLVQREEFISRYSE
ncbi:MAG: hypothetical protein KF744_17715 [Taibaiella sp.]|nr:hypothetical protein [Taibaiella sp.]